MYLLYQEYWWFIISLLAGILVFLLFVQGGNSLLLFLPQSREEESLMLNSTGRKWEFTFTTLVTFGGAFFAAFPLFYTTSFGGAYWLWIILLISFVFQAVSYEFQNKLGNILGRRFYRLMLVVNGFCGPFLLGVIVGIFFTGADFTINKQNITDAIMPIISHYNSGWHGLDAFANIWNWAFGFAIFFLSRLLGLLYFINNVEHDNLNRRSRKLLRYNGGLFIFFFLTITLYICCKTGYKWDVNDQMIVAESYAYASNFIDLPFIFISFLIGGALVIFGFLRSILGVKYDKGIWFSGVGTVVAITSLFLILGLNNTVYYPSINDLQSSLTIQNSSSSEFTLKVMSGVSLLIPIIFGYIFLVWRKLNVKKISTEELKEKRNKVY